MSHKVKFDSFWAKTVMYGSVYGYGGGGRIVPRIKPIFWEQREKAEMREWHTTLVDHVKKMNEAKKKEKQHG